MARKTKKRSKSAESIDPLTDDEIGIIAEWEWTQWAENLRHILPRLLETLGNFRNQNKKLQKENSKLKRQVKKLEKKLSK